MNLDYLEPRIAPSFWFFLNKYSLVQIRYITQDVTWVASSNTIYFIHDVTCTPYMQASNPFRRWLRVVTFNVLNQTVPSGTNTWMDWSIIERLLCTPLQVVNMLGNQSAISILLFLITLVRAYEYHLNFKK